MNEYETINQQIKESIHKDRVKILSNYSRSFADFLFQFSIDDLEWVYKDREEFCDYFIISSFEGKTVTFIHSEIAFEYYEGPDETEFLSYLSDEEYEYLETFINNLTLTDHIKEN